MRVQIYADLLIDSYDISQNFQIKYYVFIWYIDVQLSGMDTDLQIKTCTHSFTTFYLLYQLLLHIWVYTHMNIYLFLYKVNVCMCVYIERDFKDMPSMTGDWLRKSEICRARQLERKMTSRLEFSGMTKAAVALSTSTWKIQPHFECFPSDKVRPTQIIQENFPYLKSTDQGL